MSRSGNGALDGTEGPATAHQVDGAAEGGRYAGELRPDRGRISRLRRRHDLIDARPGRSARDGEACGPGVAAEAAQRVSSDRATKCAETGNGDSTEVLIDRK